MAFVAKIILRESKFSPSLCCGVTFGDNALSGVYFEHFFALFMCINLRKKKNVLIHTIIGLGFCNINLRIAFAINQENDSKIWYQVSKLPFKYQVPTFHFSFFYHAHFKLQFCNVERLI